MSGCADTCFEQDCCDDTCFDGLGFRCPADCDPDVCPDLCSCAEIAPESPA